jgi:hypothetical protein
LISWGSSSFGLNTVPVLPLGMSYSDFTVGVSHSVAIRSDGTAVAWGWNYYGACNVPPPPIGVRYVNASCSYYRTDLVRDDGAITSVGYNIQGTLNPPQSPAGLRFVEVATAAARSAALRSDGDVVLWGAPINVGVVPGAVLFPPLPFGVYYVEIAGGHHQLVARRSDGRVVVCGDLQRGEGDVPPLEPGTSYLSIDAATDTSAGVVGPQSTFVSVAPGCSGSRPATRLVPRDTPKIGRTLEVSLFDLPQDVALMAMGWQSVSPLSLAFLGMPGCDLAVTVDATSALLGFGNQAQWFLPIPDLSVLVGVHFHTQALVLDIGANPFGAVLSNASEGVVGYP